MCTVLSEFVFRVYKYAKLILILFEFVFRVYIGLYKCTKLILILCLCLGRSGRIPGGDLLCHDFQRDYVATNEKALLQQVSPCYI